MPRTAKHPGELRVCVIGAGVGGLTTAMRLQKRGFMVDLFEASDRTGGNISTVKEAGYHMELGPNTVPDRGGVISRLIEELDLEEQRQAPNNTAKKRYIVRDGKPHALPQSLGEFARTPLFSAAAKLRLFAEPLIPSSEDEPEDAYDESLYNLAKRRLGEELANYALDPFIAGTYAGDPRKLSSHHVLKRLQELEREYGSLILGGVRAAMASRDKKKQQPERKEEGSGELVNFHGGVQTLTDALTEALNEGSLRYNRPVERVRHLGERGFEVTAKGLEPQAYDAVVMGLQATSFEHIELLDARRERVDTTPIHTVTHPPVTMMGFGFRRSQIDHPLDGFGMLVPSAEPFSILGAVFSSTVFANRAPDDHVLMMVFLGGRTPEDALLPESQQIELAMKDLKQLLGVRGIPAHVRSKTWAQSIPQYEVGYGRVLARAEEIEKSLPGLYMMGTWRDGISVADVVRHAEEVSNQVKRYLYP
ncbi:MAG: protoporphyrinogen oxidase [Myxococcota bacterium]|nr:protoporphyrinogen oxidase [Myxococcota bacterium]MEC9443122.1 protoporphyrinogen oxidase [Myxococcota bacterium]